MSKLEVDKVTPQSGTTLTIGEAGDTTVINGLGTLPSTIGTNGQVLSVNSGATGLQYGAAVTNLDNLNATNLTSGTVPDARFPSTLPTANGQNLTAINPTAISSGTLPALNAANLTNLNATAITSGTLPDARFPAALPAISGAALTNLPAGGKILQVVQGFDTNFQTTTSGSYASLTLNASITPASSSNKILVIVAASFGIDGTGNAYFDIQKSINGGAYSSLGGGDGFGERINNNGFAPGALMTLNGAGTTDSINYKIFGKQSGGVTAKLGAGGYSVIMLLEVAA